MKLFYEEILVGDVITNRSMTVDEALELTEKPVNKKTDFSAAQRI